MKNYQAPHHHLKNRVILVTGAAQGLGRTAAMAFAKQGATVILLDKPEKESNQANKLEETYDAIQAAG